MSNASFDVPARWSQQNLVELVDVLDYARVPVSTYERARRPGAIPYYGSTQRVGWIDEALFDEPLLLVSEDGSHFLQDDSVKAYQVDGPSWVNNHAHVLRVDEAKVRRPFLTYFLNQLDYTPYINGTTRQKLTKRALANIQVPVPPLEEQDDIVKALDSMLSLAQRGEARLQRARDATEAYRSTMLRAVFSGALISSYPRAVAQALVEAPRQPLRTLASIKYGYTAKATTEAVGPHMLRITDIQEDGVDWATVPYCVIEDGEREALRLQKGDVVFARMGFTTGKSYLVGSDVPDAVYASYLIRVRANDVVVPDFLALYFQSSEYWAYVFSKRQGIDRPTINGKVLGDLEVPVPDIETQAIAVDAARRQLDAVRALKQTLTDKQIEARSLRASLLYQAFTGALMARPGSSERKNRALVLASE